ncbi:MAG: hypothetical protein V1660_02745 [archaeon]
MLLFSDFVNSVTNSQMAFASVMIIVYLIVIEVLGTESEEKSSWKIFNPLVIVLVCLFTLIVVKKVMGILK